MWSSDAIFIEHDHGEGDRNGAGADRLEDPMDFATHRKAKAERWYIWFDEAENGLGHQDEKLATCIQIRVLLKVSVFYCNVFQNIATYPNQHACRMPRKQLYPLAKTQKGNKDRKTNEHRMHGDVRQIAQCGPTLGA